MLASHPAIAVPPETAFVRRFVLTRRLRGRSPQRVRALLEGDQAVRRLGLDMADIPADLGGKAIYGWLMSRVMERLGKPLLVDKDPRLIESLPEIRRRWPEVVIVHVIRDPRDVLASKKQAGWSRGRSVIRHLMAGRAQLALGRRHGRTLFGKKYVEVVYEQLIAHPLRALKPVCQALDVDFDGRMLEFAAEGCRLVSAEERSWKAATLGPLLSGNSGKWRSGLSSWEAALVERSCGEAMQVGGYIPARPELSTFDATRTAVLASLIWSAAGGYCLSRQWRARLVA